MKRKCVKQKNTFDGVLRSQYYNETMIQFLFFDVNMSLNFLGITENLIIMKSGDTVWLYSSKTIVHIKKLNDL